MRCPSPFPLILVASLVCFAGNGGPAAGGENYALLVGVGDYDVKELRPLKFTRADVLALHARLLESGFAAENVVLMHDDLEKLVAHYRKLGTQYKPQNYQPRGENIRNQLKLLLGRLGRNDSVVVAFSGHGVQFRGEKTSYFCPADAKLEKKDSLIAFGDVFAALKDSQASRRLLLVDACQNDPLTSLAKSRQTVDLESTTRPQDTTVPEGIIALFSCRAGQKSFEMPELGHGVFFHHLLEAWDGKGDLNEDGKLSYQELAEFTRRETAQYAAVRLQVLQTPQLKADFSGEWILRELSTRRRVEPPSKPTPDPAKIPAVFDFTANARSAEEAKASQEAWAKHLGVKAVETNGFGMELVLLPPGKFRMGSPDSDEDADDDEKPQVEVTLTQPLYVGKTEVTQSQWQAVMGTTPWKGKKYVREGPDYAASYIEYWDLREFFRTLSAKEGKTYRLLTEAEWEYACRAGTTSKYYFGDSDRSLGAHAWYDANTTDVGEEYAHEVGKKRANQFGLHDMCGNVFEWCRDAYGEKLQGGENPTGAETFNRLVIRGGYWGQSTDFHVYRSAARHWSSSLYRIDGGKGFRVARVP